MPSPTPLPPPVFTNPLDPTLAQEAAAADAAFVRLDGANTGVWQYASGSFIHPIALEVAGDVAYLLDAGRVLRFELGTAAPTPPQVVLAPGDEVDGVRVLEPLDLAVAPGALLVLDRAGDVYRYEFAREAWLLDRYDRPVEESSGHYFVAVDAPDGVAPDDAWAAARVLLETSYKFTMTYGGARPSLWPLRDGRSVDVGAYGAGVYVLQRAMDGPDGTLSRYEETRYDDTFAPQVAIEQPRQVVATATAVYVLDHGGRRLLALQPKTGQLLRVYQPPREEPVSAFWADAAGQRLIFAGRERLYFYEEPERLAAVGGGPVLTPPQPHDPDFLAALLGDFTVPIGGSNITARDFQMPGAPRHYRLGIHEGVDFYWRPGTQVVAAAAGEVVRAEVTYRPPTEAQIDAWWRDAQARGYTAAEMLDNYRGRQVWIRHANGVVTRYAHLRAVAPGIAEGVTVTRGQVIGEVGNSGSPASLESETADAHLHFEMWLNGAYVGQFLRPIEAREWIEQILQK